ncbi:hypothetical protein ACFHYQ_04770 [Sphaerimonospora cavernae]|uniref:Uncharacterized protein n=1 Tax=Sphaerimonospora cavernae TaxID=1740611 RepID=A0ABV6TZH7_9ACTN
MNTSETVRTHSLERFPRSFADCGFDPAAHLTANAAWLTPATIAHNLLRATGCLASVFHAKARGATSRPPSPTPPGSGCRQLQSSSTQNLYRRFAVKQNMMKTMIGASLLAGSLLVSGATAANAQVKPTLGPHGYGAVKLGMTVKQAKATRKVVQKMPGGGGCSGWDLKKFPTPKDSVGVYISPKVGLAAIFAAKGMRTPEGIKIGSTAKQLKAAYPHIKKDFHGFYSITVPGNKKAYYTFGVTRGKVTEYGMALNEQDCFN